MNAEKSTKTVYLEIEGIYMALEFPEAEYQRISRKAKTEGINFQEAFNKDLEESTERKKNQK